MKVEFLLKDKTNAEAIEFVPAEFENIVWIPDSALVPELTKRVPLFDGKVPVNGTVGDQVADALQQMLAEQNVKAHVAMEMRTKDENPVAVVFSTDNVEIKITKVDFNGASNAALFELRPAANPLINSEFHRSAAEAFGQNQLLSVYRKAGYLQAKIGSPQIAVLENKEGATTVSLTYPVTEGVPYKFMGIKFTGNQALAEDRLQELVHLKPRDFANGVELDKTFDRVRAEYARSGYMKMTLTPQPQFDDANRNVTFNAVIKEGTLYTMGELAIVGLSKEEEKKVRQDWHLRVGDPFDVSYLKKFLGAFDPTEHGGRRFVIEQSEGDQPNSIDVTIILCQPGTACDRKPDILHKPDSN
jgi:outer membrane protein assembly factor BamA